MGRPRRTDQTSQALRHEIARGRFHGRAVLPGERQLALLLHVSRTTLRRALAELVEEGLLSQRHGMGTFVNRPQAQPINIPVDRPLDYVGLNGRVASASVLWSARGEPTAEEAMTFGLQIRDDVVRVARLLSRHERPEAVEYWTAPARLMPTLAGVEQSVLGAVASQGHRVATRLQRLQVTTLAAPDAARLDAPPDAPAISLREAYFLAEGGCCAINRALYPADRLDALFSGPLPQAADS